MPNVSSAQDWERGPAFQAASYELIGSGR
jgi:hypothetical protein